MLNVSLLWQSEVLADCTLIQCPIPALIRGPFSAIVSPTWSSTWPWQGSCSTFPCVERKLPTAAELVIL